MKRFNIIKSYRNQESLIMNEDENGDFVKYEDMITIVSKLISYHEMKGTKERAKRWIEQELL